MRRSVLNRFTSWLVNHLALSLLWLAGCVPLITAPVATAALFEVARLRDRDGGNLPVGRSFLAACREYLRPALLVGLAWAGLGAMLVLDLVIVGAMADPAGTVLRVALLALLLLYAAGSVALFPVLVSYQARPHQLIRTAVLVVLLSPGRSLLGLAVVAAAGAAVWFMPLAIIIVPSLAAVAVQRLHQVGFERLVRGRSDPAGRERRRRTWRSLQDRADTSPDPVVTTPRPVVAAGRQ